MKPAAYALLTFVVVLALGCVHVEETITFHADGSGTLDLTYGMSEERIASLETAVGDANGGESPFDFDEDSIREEFTQLATDGVSLKSVRVDERDGWKHVSMQVAFDNLAGLIRTPLMSDRFATLRKEEDGRYVFRQRSGGPGNSGAAADDEEDQAMREFMKGLRVTIHIRTPGPVLDTSAPERTNNEVTWEFDLEKNPDAIRELENLDMWVAFDGKGLNLPELRPSVRF